MWEKELGAESSHCKQALQVGWVHPVTRGCAGCALHNHLPHPLSKWCPLGLWRTQQPSGIFKNCMGHRIIHCLGVSCTL
jgi:hypothetical protein